MSELESIKRQAAELTKLGLKSDAAVIQRLCPAIAAALRAGFSHQAIHGTLGAAGFVTTWTNYRIALGRASKALATTTTPKVSALGVGHAAEPAFEAGMGETNSVPQKSGEMRTLSGTSSATRVMDALRQAREVANSKDYGRIGRDLYRQQQRDQRRKDRP
ncbi:hypothetical protein [Variovorax sp. dw_954]|uniref:hypothetical protein n=1 Tax=Variovorax sp. dw_954 TaxID=2720078 RepID=UPI001BD4F1A6|nr:hypothetical protein [Variovorax sp. dw_954]